MVKFKNVSMTLIDKGWSGDKKYCMTNAQGEKYLLRISPKEKYEFIKKMTDIQRTVTALTVPNPQTIDFGKCDDGVYLVQTWVFGSDAKDIIPHLSSSDQYSYGIESGRLLQIIHSIPAPKNQVNWESRFNQKMNSKIQSYNQCEIQFEGSEHLINYIKANRYLLANRPQCLQHGDYHIGNMMIEDDKIVIIDFERYDFGDPWEEFNRIVWCAQISPSFASGMLDGYFNDDIPDQFWRLLALYISSNLLSSIPWAIPFGENEIQTMLEQAKEVLTWYDNMTNTSPTWYTRKC
ncbi:aminoglycoside phosphotransferase family protein [Enterococcus alcedinis]|uniref:Aminoglycoside phosphotransferase n=1 Tax=Enterococcus alcedinis TaxID=1274384 RepID=A0A917JGH2_9ENTE|nr:phosphotransferase [Enterococcus alcedinis]MBP2101834.1 aminoglycoside phosphotransferase (APT) family kinase protein [Enterococcus alcedinis]GGI65397.1 aminoglycoside phosphotransferase [Enterococcus alcedinis]